METDLTCLQKLENILRHYKRLAVAASGGMDSTFLAYVAKEVLADEVLAISLRSAFSIDSELEKFRSFAQKHGIPHAVIEVDILNNENVVRNAADRCYYCKKEMFQAIAVYAKRHGFGLIADGSNLSDMEDYRPGMRALQELSIASPLKAAGFTKSDIVRAVRSLKIDLPSMHPNSCLAARIAYGIPLTPEVLQVVREGERILAEKGIAPVRVRYHNAIARIEMPHDYIHNVINDEELLKEIIAAFKALGFQYVTIDLEGYRRGSMNST